MSSLGLVGDGVGEDCEPFRNSPFTFIAGRMMEAGSGGEALDSSRRRGGTMTTAAAAIFRHFAEVIVTCL